MVNRSVCVAVEWGDDFHECPMSLQTWRRVVSGHKVLRVEPYHYEGERFRARWEFNHDGLGSLYVTYDDAGVGFDGSMDDAFIRLHDVRVEWSSCTSDTGGRPKRNTKAEPRS